jgi:hypothetical protein
MGKKMLHTFDVSSAGVKETAPVTL